MHDSGERQEQITGASIDPSHSSAAMELLSPYSLWRLAQWMGKGAMKYALRNWEKGIKFSICIGKIQRHLQQYIMGVKDKDDHLGAVGFWWHALSHYEAMIDRGLLPKELDDMPHYERQKLDPEGDFIKKIDDEIVKGLPELPQDPQKALLDYCSKRSKITAYLSHPIRGTKGKAATDEYKRANCKRAIQVGNELRRQFPELDLYIPAKNEDFVNRAYKKKYLTIAQILQLDCEIVGEQDVLIVYNPEYRTSDGMKREMKYAKKHNIPIYSFTHLDPITITELKLFFAQVKEKL